MKRSYSQILLPPVPLWLVKSPPWHMKSTKLYVKSEEVRLSISMSYAAQFSNGPSQFSQLAVLRYRLPGITL